MCTHGSQYYQVGKAVRRAPSEADILRLILDWCKANRIFVRRRNVAGAQKLHGSYVRLGNKGEADLWGILPGGRHFECELKKPGKEPGKEQLEWLSECRGAGAVAFWCDSLDEFVEWMQLTSETIRERSRT